MAYTKYSLTPADNNAAPPNGAPEGMLPSAVNDTMRDMMSQIRDVGDGIRGGTYTMTAPVITGGSINNTTIGATTATTATFTAATVNTLTDSQGGVLAPISSVMRNRIINGGMVLDQRRAGASVTIPAALTYTLDRWQGQSDQASKYSVEQTITGVAAPTGFSNYLGCTSLSAYSVLTGDRFVIRQAIEGFNVADLGFGTADAKTITISFWVRSSLTGSFGGYVGNSALNRTYPFSYTISAANTWEQKSVTIAGDTSGTWLTDNGVGIRLGFSLGVGATYTGTGGAWAASQILAPTGSTSVVGTNGATFYITGVQLEVGTQATSFEYRMYQQELALCQRYYYKIFPAAVGLGFGCVGSVNNGSTTTANMVGNFPVTMRIIPTALEQSGTANQYTIAQFGTGNFTCTSVPTYTSNTSFSGFGVGFTSTGLTAGSGCAARTDATNGANAFLAWSAEL
jgi:hypothetical protein